MAISTEITRIQQAKADIKTAIETKGVTVPSSATIDVYDDYVSQISGGGGGSEDLKKMIDRTITSIVIPSDVTLIGNSAFYNCGSLTSVTIPNSVTIIGNSAFNSTNILRVNSNTNGVVNIPSGVTTISGSSFGSCRSITSVTIPDSVTTIGGYAFYTCTSLRNVTIGSGVTSIGSAAFAYTNSIISFTCNAVTPPTIGINILANASANLVIYVPSASVDTYKSASGWSTYASQIQAIP